MALFLLRPIAAISGLVLLAGCRAQPAPRTVANLHFPVVVIFGNQAVVTYRNAEELGTMQIGHLNAVIGPPPLIDSDYEIYTLTKLGSTHNGLWLMAHPTGSTPVSFELVRVPKSGIEAARELLRSRLDEQTWRSDLEEKRRALAGQQTLAGMVGVVQPGGDSVRLAD